MNTLPNELIKEISSLLSYSDFSHLSRTCKKFNQISKDDTLWSIQFNKINFPGLLRNMIVEHQLIFNNILNKKSNINWQQHFKNTYHDMFNRLIIMSLQANPIEFDEFIFTHTYIYLPNNKYIHIIENKVRPNYLKNNPALKHKESTRIEICDLPNMILEDITKNYYYHLINQPLKEFTCEIFNRVDKLNDYCKIRKRQIFNKIKNILDARFYTYTDAIKIKISHALTYHYTTIEYDYEYCSDKIIENPLSSSVVEPIYFGTPLLLHAYFKNRDFKPIKRRNHTPDPLPTTLSKINNCIDQLII